MKGYELVGRIRSGSVPKFKPIPMLTGHDTPQNLRRAHYNSVSGFIPKTAMLEHLGRQIRRMHMEKGMREVL